MAIIYKKYSSDWWLAVYTGSLILISFPFNLLRLSGATAFNTTLYLNFTLVLAGVAAIAVTFKQKKAFHPVWKIVFVYVIFVFYILAIGLLKENDGVFSALRYYLLPLVVLLLLVSRNFCLFFLESEKFWVIATCVQVCGLAYYFYELRGSIYPAIGVPAPAYAALFFFVRRYWVLFVVAVLVVILEGKRGILLSMLLTLPLISLVRVAVLTRFVRLSTTIFAFSLMLSIFLYMIADVENWQVITRINYLNPFSAQFDLFMGSSGRLGEMVSFFSLYAPIDLVLGVGAGFEYDWELGYGSRDVEVKGYFHTTIMNYVAVGGVFGVAVFLFIALQPFLLKTSANVFGNQVRDTAFAFGAFSVILSFFGFSFSVNIPGLIFIFFPAFLAAMKPAGAMAHAGTKPKQVGV